jgi:hypothetical protein
MNKEKPKAAKCARNYAKGLRYPPKSTSPGSKDAGGLRLLRAFALNMLFNQ